MLKALGAAALGRGLEVEFVDHYPHTQKAARRMASQIEAMAQALGLSVEVCCDGPRVYVRSCRVPNTPNMPNIPPPPPRKIGTGAEALAREEAAQDPDEPCRVRRVFDGKYLAWDDTGGRGTYTFDAESVWPRSRATVIANAMIVLTGEHDIEVEPVGR